MGINLEPIKGEKIELLKNIPSKKINAHTNRLIPKTGIRLVRMPKRRRFTQKLDSYKKVLSSTIKPVSLAVPYLQKLIRGVPSTGYFSPGSIDFIQNIVYGISDGIVFLRNSVNLPNNIRTTFKMQKLQENFDDNFNYSWNTSNTTLKQLDDEKHKILEQINTLKILKLKKQFLEQTPELITQIKYINNILSLKQRELKHINEYLTIKSLKNLNSNRVKSKITNMVSSGIGFISRSTICAVSSILGNNPLTYIPTIIFLNNMFNFVTVAKDIFSNFSTFLAKREKAKNLINVISDIPSSSINQDIIKKSKLIETPLTTKDIHTLSRLKFRSFSSPYLDLPDDIKNVLSNVGKNCLNLEQITKLSEFLESIEKNKAKLTYEDLTLVENLRNGINNFNTLLDEYDDDTISFHVNLNNTKVALKEAYHESKDVLYNHKNWVYKALYEKQFFSNESTFNMKVFDYFIEHANISVDLKNKLLENSDVSQSSIWNKFNNLDSELSQKAQNEHIANFIIDMVMALPPRKGIIKNGVAVPVEKLDLKNTNDKILLNEVYENWREYDHAKSFIKSILTGSSTKSANKLIDKIKEINTAKKHAAVYNLILSELSSING